MPLSGGGHPLTQRQMFPATRGLCQAGMLWGAQRMCTAVPTPDGQNWIHRKCVKVIIPWIVGNRARRDLSLSRLQNMKIRKAGLGHTWLPRAFIMSEQCARRCLSLGKGCCFSRSGFCVWGRDLFTSWGKRGQTAALWGAVWVQVTPEPGSLSSYMDVNWDN